MEIRVKKLTETAKLPVRGSADAAGFDLYADLQRPLYLHPGEVLSIGTGLSMEIPKGYFGAIYARSGLAFKKGLRPPNCVGVIDSDYRGEISVGLYNDSPIPQLVSPGERVAQIIIQPHMTVEFTETDDLSETVRGGGGFGSTGV